MRGSLGRVIPSANTDTVLFTVSANCSYALVDIFIVNPNATNPAIVQVSISSDGTASSNEYIEKGTIVAKEGGTHEITYRNLSPGDNVIVRSDQADTIFRIEGSEEVIY